MLYMLQVDVLVAIVILFAFFALYLVLMALRLGYFAAVRLVQIAKPNTAHLTKEMFSDGFNGFNGWAHSKPISCAHPLNPLNPSLNIPLEYRGYDSCGIANPVILRVGIPLPVCDNTNPAGLCAVTALGFGFAGKDASCGP
jgi:hypothetical protein